MFVINYITLVISSQYAEIKFMSLLNNSTVNQCFLFFYKTRKTVRDGSF